MTPKVNKEVCIGCGACAAICPAVFKMGDDGKTDVIEGVDYVANEATMNQAKDSCPVAAISVE
jgi:ferredoxin